MTSPIFVITGSNKGIGRALVEKLMKAAPPSSLIYLTSRNPDLGQQTLQEIQQSSQSSKSQLAYHQLDVSDQKSIQDFASYIKRQHPNKIDVLVNNAGIATKGSAFDADIVRNTLHTNFYGLKSMCEHFVPLIKDGGRIVNVSSMAGKTRSLKSEELKAKFHDPKASVDDIVKLMQKFQNDVDSGNWQNEWPSAAYSVSKMGVSGYTEALARQYPNLLINATCPGYISTDMSSHKGTHPPEEGAERVGHLALADLKGVTGKFWENKQVSSW